MPQEVACICAFGSPNMRTTENKNAKGERGVEMRQRTVNQAQGTIYAICLDGSFHKYHFSEIEF